MKDFTKSVILTALVIIGAFASQPVMAQAASLFLEVPHAVVKSTHGISALSARIDRSVIARGAEFIAIPLPDGRLITARLIGFERRGRGNFTWRGTTEAGSEIINVTLTLQRGFVAGSIDIDGSTFEILPQSGAGQRHTIELLDLESFDEGLTSDAVAGDSPAGGSETTSSAIAADLASDEIHLLSVYSPQAEAGAGGTGQIEAAIQSAVDLSNTAFINSNMDARFVLVHTSGVARNDSGNGDTDLNWVRTDATVATLRDTHGADLVSLVTETGSCGLGYVLQSLAGSPGYAFQVSRRDCVVGNKTLTHEHGHNMGFAHNPENASVGGIFTDSYGHYVDGDFRTIMSYSAQCGSGCPRESYFSDPATSYLGFPTGIAGQRDNAATGRQSAAVVAAYRAAATGGNSQSIQISTGNDDVEERASDGVLDFGSTDIELGNDPGHNADQTEGLRFNGLNVPQGATITQAYLTFTVDEPDTVTTIVDIHAEDADNAGPFTATINNVTGRPLTAAKATWNIPDWNTVGATHDSPDLSAVLQEVVDRPAWAAGNSIAFIIFGTGSRTAESYNGVAGSAPRLVVEYTTIPPVGIPPVAAFTFGCTNLECSFTDTSTDSDGTIASRSWNFGDGNTSTSQNPNHTYATSGNYNVSLAVTDNDGDSDASVQSVTAGTPQVSRGPYLQTLTEDSIIVRWRTDLATDSVVRYGLSAGALTSTASVAGSRTEHTVTLTGLGDLTQYFYSIGDSAGTIAGDASYYFSTAPVPGTAVPTRFWAIGDSGTANANAHAVRDAYKSYAATSPSDFMLMLGDNAYNDGFDSEYQAAVFDTYPVLLRRLPVWSTLGNHDGHQADSATQSGPYYDIFDFPTGGEAGGLASGTEAYYSFDYGNIHFIVLDSYETDRSTGGTMLTWMESDLGSNTKPWVIAIWHHPPYTKGSHDSDTESQLIDMRQNALPILEAWGVDLVLSGHSHSYERSMLVDGHYGTSGTLVIPTMIKDIGDGSETGDGAYQKPEIVAAMNEGAVYAVAGSSGKTSGGSLNHPVMYVSLNVLGSMVIDVDGNRLDAVFIDSTNPNPVIKDEFTILKNSSLPQPPTASFTHTTYNRTATFTDTSTDSDGSVVSWLWDFGDTASSTTQSPVHTYTADGSYTVTLTVTDNDTETDLVSEFVTLEQDVTPPVITILGANPASVGEKDVYADAGATALDNQDGDLTSSITITSPAIDTSIPGNQTVTYSVTDLSGNNASADRTVTVVANVAPTADFSNSVTGLSVDFTDASSDSDGSVVVWSWDFGDGNGSTVQNPSHSYTAEGTYIVDLNITDNDGASGFTSMQVTVTAPPTLVEVTAEADLLGSGTVSGTFTDTHGEDGNAQSITERESGGKKQNRHSFLVHSWRFSLPVSSLATVNANAWSGGSSDDNFRFSWSTDNSSYNYMFTVSRTDATNLESFALPFGTSGTVYIRVEDTDQTAGNKVLDTVFVDHLYILADSSVVAPPVAPTMLSAVAAGSSQINLSWTDVNNEAGFKVERSTNGTDFSEVGSTVADDNTFSDSGLNPTTTYWYRVYAYNAGGPSAYSETVSATTDDGWFLNLSGSKSKGKHVVELNWSGATADNVDIFRDDELLLITVSSDTGTGQYIDNTGNKGGRTYRYQVCDADTANCSAIESISF